MASESSLRAAARVTIHRTSPRDVKDRQLLVSLDGVRVATLMFGQSRTIEVQPGEHRLRVNNTLVWKTVSFVADGGDELHFTVVNRAPGLLLEMLTFVGVAVLVVDIERGLPREGAGRAIGLG
jgi:hypothetical protein